MKIHLDKISSTTINCRLPREVEIVEEIKPEMGNVVAVRALEEKIVYDKLELTTGRLAKISKNDTIAGVLGKRSALKGFVGIIPENIHCGDILNILNIGGVIGKTVSYNREFGKPLSVEVLGTITINGSPVNIKDNALKLVSSYTSHTPLIVVSGTTMNCGKTITVSKVIRGLTSSGYRVGSGKITGIGALKDTLNMLDYGALKALSFLDFGYPSTVDIDEIDLIAYSIINEIDKSQVDIIVLELGDGIFGEYGVANFFENKSIAKNIKFNIACATDQVGAWGILKYMQEQGIEVDLISGPVTDNDVGKKFIEKRLDVKAINSIDESDKITDYILSVLKKDKS